MAAARTVRFEEQFLCCICLDLFTEPVTTPCGHNFCKSCITQHWDSNASCFCPMCKEVFPIKPLLRVNTLISESVSQFKDEARSRSKQQVSKPGEVSCDVCSEPKLKALKSCLVCLASFCETHLEPHLTVSGLKRHQLMEPVENLEDRLCLKHDKPLERFCRIDQICVCSICLLLEHKYHNTVPLKKESEQRKSCLQQTQAETQQMVDQRRLKIQEIQRSVELSEEAAGEKKKEVFQVFTNIKASAQTCLDEFIEVTEEEQRKHKKQAQDLVKVLELEISELMKRHTEVEQLSHSEDHLRFLQSSPLMKPAPILKNWSTVSFEPASFEGTAATALCELQKTLNRDINMVQLRRVQRFAVDFTLDPDTAHCYLVLSKDLKQVHHSDVRKNLPDNPKRFSVKLCVLLKQSFSSSRFYYEVQVKGKTKWDLGVVKESVNRKENEVLNPQNGYWAIVLRNGDKYRACAKPCVPLSLKCAPQKVGVFVDYDEGLVSFYDANTADLIYSFTGCCFEEKILPFFSPCHNEGGTNASPLIITPVP